ncbi:MAG TPA: SlyX family protein [Lacunisphaera sp.]|nr:SlyX family protein [Lacunisphaera sp.]
MTDAERLTLLEERYAHLQRHVAQQDQAMLELGDELARLRREVQALRAQIAGGVPDGRGEESTGERPPHY